VIYACTVPITSCSLCARNLHPLCTLRCRGPAVEFTSASDSPRASRHRAPSHLVSNIGWLKSIQVFVRLSLFKKQPPDSDYYFHWLSRSDKFRTLATMLSMPSTVPTFTSFISATVHIIFRSGLHAFFACRHSICKFSGVVLNGSEFCLPSSFSIIGQVTSRQRTRQTNLLLVVADCRL
jgi:hypothetical protein